MKKKILITGSGGFIGSNLKNYLTNKYDLLTPRSYELDLTNKDDVNNYFNNNKIDFIIHCGTKGGIRGIEDEKSTFADNLSMVKNLIDAKNEKVRIILFGSGAMYDKSRPLNKIREKDLGLCVPKDLYGKSKMMIAQNIKNSKDILCLNIFACYGYMEKSSRFPSYAIDCVLNNKTICINQNVIFDYLFVEDLQKIVHFFIENNPEDRIINITPDKSISLLEIAQIVNSFSNVKSEIKILNTELNNEYTGSNTILKKYLPNYKFEDYSSGLKKLYDYINIESLKNLNMI